MIRLPEPRSGASPRISIPRTVDHGAARESKAALDELKASMGTMEFSAQPASAGSSGRQFDQVVVVQFLRSTAYTLGKWQKSFVSWDTAFSTASLLITPRALCCWFVTKQS